MHTRWLILSLLTLATAGARAQEAAPAPVAPLEVAPTEASTPVPQPAPPTSAPAAPYDPSVHHPARAGAAVQYRLPQPYVTPPPRPEPKPPRRHGRAGAPFALALGAGFMWRGASSQRALTDDASNAGFELLATYDVWAPTPRLIVAAGLDLRTERIGDPDALAVYHRTVQAELQPRIQVTRWLYPHVRLAVGVVSTRLRLEDASGLDFTDRDAHVAGTLGAGFTLRTPARTFETYAGRLSSLSLGLTLEGGYTLAPEASLRAEPSADAEIARTTFSLGTLKRSGAYLRAMIALRF